VGYYTTIKTKPIILRKDLPEEIVNFIHNEIYGEAYNENAWHPEHKLFTLKRWTVLFAHCSGNEPPPYFKKLPNGYYELFLHADINYGFEECQEFAKWITPYVAGRKKNEYIGWCKGEDYDSPVVNLYVQRA
jgi:hypothetical protein